MNPQQGQATEQNLHQGEDTDEATIVYFLFHFQLLFGETRKGEDRFSDQS